MSEHQARLRMLIAEAVHDAVCTFTQSDGFGLCHLYAVAGYTLLTQMAGPQWTMHAGSMWLAADPPDGWCYFNAGRPHAFERGDFHCWLVQHGPAKGDPPAACVDFTARHFRRWVEQSADGGGWGAGVRLPWTHTEEPPPYVWTTAASPLSARVALYPCAPRPLRALTGAPV
jgi:hypothetical protein